MCEVGNAKGHTPKTVQEGARRMNMAQNIQVPCRTCSVAYKGKNTELRAPYSSLRLHRFRLLAIATADHVQRERCQWGYPPVASVEPCYSRLPRLLSCKIIMCMLVHKQLQWQSTYSCYILPSQLWLRSDASITAAATTSVCRPCEVSSRFISRNRDGKNAKHPCRKIIWPKSRNMQEIAKWFAWPVNTNLHAYDALGVRKLPRSLPTHCTCVCISVTVCGLCAKKTQLARKCMQVSGHTVSNDHYNALYVQGLLIS